MRRMLAALGCALLALPAAAPATPHHAHWHYMVGARAGAAKSFARQLWWEASQPGELHLELAHANAVDLAILAREIGDWAAGIEAVSLPGEREAIAAELATMRRAAGRLATRADGLAERIAAALAEPPPDDDEVAAFRAGVAQDAAGLFHGFHAVLAAHKRAEVALGIPVPADPPDPAGS